MALNVNEIELRIGYYLAGFSDGEGSFNISIRKHPGYKLGWKTSLTFNVSQKGSAPPPTGFPPTTLGRKPKR